MFYIVTIVGTSTIYYNSINAKGRFERQKNTFHQAPGRILKFYNDEQYKCGTLLLTDTEHQHADYEEHGNSYLYTFPLAPVDDAQITLHCLKRNRIFPLLSSSDQKSINYDSFFIIDEAD